MYFSQNNLTTFWSILQDKIFNFLKILDVSRNKISRIFNPGKGIEAFKLQNFNISSNVISNIESFGMNIFISLSILDLSDNYITILKNNVFYGLVSLRQLILWNNPLHIVKSNAFADLHLQFVLSNNHQVCCATKIHNITCCSKIWHLLPCGKLLRNLLFTTITPIESIVIILCNAISIYWYMFGVKRKDRKGIEINRFQWSINLLHLINSFYGIYLGIISITNFVRGEGFFEEYHLWKCGIICYFFVN